MEQTLFSIRAERNEITRRGENISVFENLSRWKDNLNSFKVLYTKIVSEGFFDPAYFE